MLCLFHAKRVKPFLRFGREGRNSSVRRVHDQRSPHGLGHACSTIGPEIVIGAACQVRCASFPFDKIGVSLLDALLLEGSGFFGSEKLLRSQLGWPLKRRDGGVRPGALQIRLAVGGSRHGRLAHNARAREQC